MDRCCSAAWRNNNNNNRNVTSGSKLFLFLSFAVLSFPCHLYIHSHVVIRDISMKSMLPSKRGERGWPCVLLGLKVELVEVWGCFEDVTLKSEGSSRSGT